MKECSPSAKLVETNVTAPTEKQLSVTFGKCVFENMKFVENTTKNIGGDFNHYAWNATEAVSCGTDFFDFALLHCHQNDGTGILDKITRRKDRCYLDIGNSTSGEKCVYEERGNWSVLDWAFPVAIVLAVFGCTCCCCLKNRIRKASRPRGPILDTEPEQPDAAYNARDSPFQ